MVSLCKQVPVLPKVLPLLVNSSNVVLPGCVEIIILNTLNNTSSKFEYDANTTIVGLTIDTKIGTIGTAAYIDMIAKDKAVLSGICRFQIEKIIINDSRVSADIKQIDKHDNCKELINSDKDIANLITDVRNEVYSYSKFSEIIVLVKSASECYLPELCTRVMKLSFEEALNMLNALDLKERLKLTLKFLKREKASRQEEEIKKLIPDRPFKSRIMTEVITLENTLKQINFPKAVQKIVNDELKTLRGMSPVFADYKVIYNYLTLLANLPWDKYANEFLDLNIARKTLEQDHYGLQEVKKRILEYLAIYQLNQSKGEQYTAPILCLIGPPGVGKTSIAHSIATSLNRPFARISLAGVTDVATIRGHRRTYVGAMPGRIIESIKQCGVKNPVILLDEVDKIGRDVNSCAAAALLEVLDPKQNQEFTDNYMNMPFDLSHILFIATANSTARLTPAMLDRFEIIDIPGYSYLEKIHIASNHLLPKQLKQIGLNDKVMQVPEETIKLLVSNYTREAGVRDLERQINKLCRWVTLQLALKKSNDSTQIDETFNIDIPTAKKILGPMKPEDTKWSPWMGRPGIAISLAVSSIGGSIFPVESSVFPGSGKLVLTGSLGEVFKESSTLAWAWVRSNANMYGINLKKKRMDRLDVHIHVPEGAVCKDGPSAGVTVATSLMSLLLNKPLLPKVAMTGEITLQGIVISVGGIKHKIIAAHKAGFTKIIIPKDNKKDLHEMPSCIKGTMTFVCVSNMHAVLEAVFEDGCNLINPSSKL